jgi:hypothetical protein
MSQRPISKLRRRMLEDMAVRKFNKATVRVAPLPPHSVHRAEWRSVALEASAPQRMIHGAGVRRA